MLKKIFLMTILTALVVSGCGSSLDSPPLVYLVRNGELIDGFQSSYCWDQGVGAAICVDTIEPYFEETIRLTAGEPIRFQFDTPLPDEVTISISEELFGDSIQTENLPPSETIDWSPSIPPGYYIVDVHTSWKQGNVTYWFSVTLE
jgi:hypothetical protein